MRNRSRLVLTCGDVAGIGPEVILKAWPQIVEFANPVVTGDPEWLKWLTGKLDLKLQIETIEPEAVPAVVASSEVIPVISATKQMLKKVKLGEISEIAGEAAYDFLIAGIELAKRKLVDAIVTAPLNKASLHKAGLKFPGHTEILALKTGTQRYSMMLLAESFGVVHVTLHIPFRSVVTSLTTEKVLEKIQLLHAAMKKILQRKPSIGVCGLNPHAGDEGIFGLEEATIITPAIETACEQGIYATGPYSSDAIFQKAYAGKLDGVVAMYHDQGHIPVKLMSGMKAVNVTLGLPIIRTSVAHGTAFDIANEFIADPTSMVEAARVAVRLAQETV